MISFTDYQKLAIRTDKTGEDEKKSLMITLLGLSGESGSLLSEYKKWFRDGDAYKPFSHQVSEEIGDILWYLANLASKLNLDLGDIAQENLAKTEERWPKSQPNDMLFPHRFDAAFPETEQLPTKLRISLVEKIVQGEKRIALQYEGDWVGDELTDNSHVEDGYRYHDVFHIACAVMLGWSPVMRRILKRKRKTVPRTDVVEDGARALVTEEAVSAVVFGYASDHSMFERSDTVDYQVLRTIRGMVRPFEVRAKSLADWERMILESYRVWRQVIAHNGGTVIGDATANTLTFEPLPTDKK